MNVPLKKGIALLLLFLGLKGFVWIGMIGAFYYFPYHQENHFGNKYYPPSRDITLSHIFQTWDTNHYLYLAEKGYSTLERRKKIEQEIDQEQRLLYYRKIEFYRLLEGKNLFERKNAETQWQTYEAEQNARIYQLRKIERDMLNSDAFPPVYPFLIAGIQKLFSCSALLAALILSNICSCVVIFLFFCLVFQCYGESTAFWATLFWMTYPFSFVFHIAYTESLFLMVMLLFFYFLNREQWGKASIAVCFLPILRVLGILVLLPFAWNIWKQKRSWLYLLFPIGGFLLYLILMFFLSGDPFIWMKAQEGFVSKHSGSRIFQLGTWFSQTFFVQGWEWFHPQKGIIDRISFLFFLFFFWKARKDLEKTWILYLLCYGLFPGFTSIGLMSYSRYVVSAFPLFIWLGFKYSSSSFWKYGVCFCFILGQVALAARMGLNYWVC